MVKLKLEEGQIVLCEVTKIMGTIVFVKIEDYNLEGTITFAEIFPGKIRNIRDFVFPGKKIVCKVLRINPEVIELSLRRVKVNERNDFNDRYKKERNYLAMLRTVLGEKAQEVISKIKDNETNIVDFLDSAKEKPSILEKYISSEQIQKIVSILSEKRAKETLLSRKFSLLSKAPNGMVLVKSAIASASEDISSENFEVSYIAAGKYFAKIKAKDPKQADQQLRKFLENLEVFAKKNNCDFKEEKD